MKYYVRWVSPMISGDYLEDIVILTGLRRRSWQTSSFKISVRVAVVTFNTSRQDGLIIHGIFNIASC